MAVCNLDCFHCELADCVRGGTPTREESRMLKAAFPDFKAAREAEWRFLHRFKFTAAELKSMKAAADRDGTVHEVVKRRPGRPKQQLTEAQIRERHERKKARKREYYHKNKEKILAQQKEYRGREKGAAGSA